MRVRAYEKRVSGRQPLASLGSLSSDYIRIRVQVRDSQFSFQTRRCLPTPSDKIRSRRAVEYEINKKTRTQKLDDNVFWPMASANDMRE